MKIAIASGKGGTGKTTVATNLALSLDSAVLLDCDVEEPDSHIFLDVDPVLVKEVKVPVPRIHREACDLCGKCSDFCQYNALAVLPKDILLFPELCHGCGGCTLVCPQGAIIEEERAIGVIEGGKVGDLEFYRGVLSIGEAMASRVISELKKLAHGKGVVILDSPPGTSCPVMETVRGCDYCVLVTESTPFGLHDLKLAVNMLRAMGVPFGVVINRDGIGDDRVDEYCRKEGIDILMRIPDDREIARLYSMGIPFSSRMPGWREEFGKLHRLITGEVGEK